MTPEKIPLWRHIGRESVWGKRGLVKANSLWLPLALFFLKKEPEGGPQIFVPCLQILGTVCCWVLVSVLANDLSDCPEDAAAGKRRWICGLPYAASWAIVIAISTVGLGIGLFGETPAGTRWAYVAATLLGLSYSLKPFRFKEDGLWGIFIYSLACTMAYVLGASGF